MKTATRCQCCGAPFTPGTPDEYGIMLELKYAAACMSCVIDGPIERAKADSRRAALEQAAKLAEVPSGHWNIGTKKQPYWSGVEIAARIRALVTK